MLLSISSSETLPLTAPAEVKLERNYVTWIRNAAICLLLFCLLLEAVTRLAFSRISHIESRIAAEHRAALAVRKTSGIKEILLLGNSLPLEGVAVAQLQESLKGRAHITRFVIEGTEYLDWYYGIRRLFAERSNPDLVLLCMDATHLRSSRIRGDYSAFYLFQTADILQIARAANLDLTKTAGLFLGRYSLFYAGRTGIRNFALNHTDERYAELVRNLPPLTGKEQPKRSEQVKIDVEPLEASRLTALRTLCRTHDADFTLLIPPGFGKSQATLERAAETSHTDVFVPVDENEFERAKYRDGYHLNESGAKIFTERLGARLQTYPKVPKQQGP